MPVDERHLRIAPRARDPRFERESSAPELHVKTEMDRQLAAYFARKHGALWRWCQACRAWSAAHEHPAIISR